jgi:precorrin-2 dehydrogenase / sirohydrochlorin ferrochelatase
MPSYYPVMLHLEGRRVLFIGGGWETAHKVRGLLEAGAKVTLVSEHPHPELEALAAEGHLLWQRRAYQDGDVAGFWLVMSHPVNKADNAPVFAAAEAHNILCNCVDDPERCSFILPSVLKRGDLSISISTSGVAPALGVRLKQRFAEQIGPEYGDFLVILRQLRPSITNGFGDFDCRKRLWYSLMDGDALELVRQGDLEAARQRLEAGVVAQRASCAIAANRCAGCLGKYCPAVDGSSMAEA